jgi:glycosyltransferase involved in cell wall biosynthesis
MLGLAETLPTDCRTSFVSFREDGRCDEFLRVVAERGFDGVRLRHDTPRLRGAVSELTQLLAERSADVLLCHGYKANLVGRIAARRVGVPAVAVSRGWTWQSLKVRAYESLDRWHLRFMDHVICVSEGQAAKVRRAGVSEHKVSVIRNSARLAAFNGADPAYRARLRSLFPGDNAVSRVIVAAGRFSPEKGFGVLVEAAARVPSAGVVLFGDGPERARLESRVRELGLANRFVMPGFTRELDSFLPWADVLVLPSFTEGLPNVVLEAAAAGVPAVATAVGGTPEAITDGETGYLVAPGDPAALADRLARLLADEALRRRMGQAARARMHAEFSFDAQAEAYLRLFESLRPRALRVAA